MTWHLGMAILLLVLFTLIMSPLWAGLIWGRDAICGSASHSQCLRDWISSLSGPLAIVAAIIAAWPVWEQLDENRAATRLAMASVIRLEEQTIEGNMAALRQEDNEVENSKHIATDAVREITTITDNKNNPAEAEIAFNKLRAEADGFISQAHQISQEMASKTDWQKVIPARKNVERDFDRFAGEMEQVKKFENYKEAGSSLYGQLDALYKISIIITETIDNYNSEFLDTTQKLVNEREELEKKRKTMSENIALN